MGDTKPSIPTLHGECNCTLIIGEALRSYMLLHMGWLCQLVRLMTIHDGAKVDDVIAFL